MNNGGGLTGDMAIADRVNQALQSNPDTARHPIEVEAEGTTVSLRGTVDSQQAKDEAERIARNTDGVIDVTNELVIGESRGGGLFGLGGGQKSDDGVPDAGVATAAGAASIGGAGTGSGGIGSGAVAAPLVMGSERDVNEGATTDESSDPT